VHRRFADGEGAFFFDGPPELSSPSKFVLLRIGGTSRSATLNPRSGRGQRSIYIRENPKCSIKPRNFENRAQGFLQPAQEKLAAIRFNLLHG
jgi:hypothetical protein